MAWEPRNLQLLYINDVPDSFDDYTGFVNVRTIRDFSDALQLVIHQRINDRREPVDLVFCDVNMERHYIEHRADTKWNVVDGSGTMRAYGPLLALPFLFAPPWCQFVPFSSYWADPNVRTNGYVLSALAMILSATTGEPISTAQAVEQIDRWTPGEMNLSLFMRTYLPQIRQKIAEKCNTGDVCLNGLDTTIEHLRLWKFQAEREGFERQRLPLCIGNDPIYVEIVQEEGRQLSLLHVSSLFADRFDFNPPRDSVPVDYIISELQDWLTLGNVFHTQNRQAYTIARNLLFRYLPESPINDYAKEHDLFWATSLREKIEDVYNITYGSKRYFFVIRMSMLFAQVRAWYLVKKLGYSVNEFRKLVYHFLGVDRPSGSSGRSFPENPYKRLLGDKGNIGVGLHREPFRKLTGGSASHEKVSPVDAYMLDDENEPGLLDLRERYLCQQFVIQGHVHPDDEHPDDRMKWKPQDFPRWMR